MLRIKDLYPFAQTEDAVAFRARLGPFVMIQKPPAPVLQQVALSMGASMTVGMAHRSRLAQEIFALLRGFQSALVATLPVVDGACSLTVGRTAEVDLLVEEPSVSKRHAILRWYPTGTATIQDLGSTNGTFVNAKQLGAEEIVILADGDALSFGDAQFLYMLTETLHAQLRGTPLR